MAKKNNNASVNGGILNMWKPAGITSFSLVNKIKKLSNVSKVGHVGTLDPFADGVLPIAIGKSSNMIRYMNEYSKKYRVLIHFGQSTHTQDLSGEVIINSPISSELISNVKSGNYEKLLDAANSLNGKIMQKVPLYSAVKLDGKPMYWYARQGIEVPVKVREAEIFSSNLIAAGVNNKLLGIETVKFSEEAFLEFCPDEQKAIGQYFPDFSHVNADLDRASFVALPLLWAIFDVHVASGTYIRTWAEDLASKIGIGAHAFMLRRLETGPYNIATAIRVEDIEANLTAPEDLQDYYESQKFLLAPATARMDIPVLKLSETESVKVLQGQKISLKGKDPALLDCKLIKLYYSDYFLGIATIVKDRFAIQAERMFTSIEQFYSRFDK